MLPVARLVACGSVDDGKSTLIGRLLHDAGAIPEDQIAALEKDSFAAGGAGGGATAGIDFSLLTDGLEAEREQRITIDIAYRQFASARRRFIIADAPGHEQYTRNMATAASGADLALLLVDARRGMLEQTCRHVRIVAMMGVRHVILAVNKMDLVGHDRAVFERIAQAWREFAAPLGFAAAHVVPVCALRGDNLVARGRDMPWYDGPVLMELLDGIDVASDARAAPLRLPVQMTLRHGQDFRGFCGRIAAGSVRPGDRVRVLPSGVETRVSAIVMPEFMPDGAADGVGAGDSVTVALADPVDAGRGAVIASCGDAPRAADQFEATLLWMAARPLIPGRPYRLRIHCSEVTATITQIRHVVDPASGARLAARTAALNAIVDVTLSTSEPVVFEPYAVNRVMGGFILIDREDRGTAGAGMIRFALRRTANLRWQALEVDRRARAALNGHEGRCIWLTGLSGAGKSTLANLLEKRLHADGLRTYILDGDNVRHGLNRDLGFTDADRVENIRRVAEVARLMVDAGLIVIVAFISPFRAERRMARELFAPGDFVEVFVDAPLAECERRDAKGLYAKARRGELKNFTGIDSAYEPPETPDVHLRTGDESPEACVARLLEQTGHARI